MYTIVSFFYSITTSSLIGIKFHIIVGSFAAFAQAALRPLLSVLFYWYRVHDQSEVSVKPDVTDMTSNDLLAPKELDFSIPDDPRGDLLAPTSGFDGDVYVDEALNAHCPVGHQPMFFDFSDPANDADRGFVGLDTRVLLVDGAHPMEGLMPDLDIILDGDGHTAAAAAHDTLDLDDVDFATILDGSSSAQVRPSSAAPNADLPNVQETSQGTFTRGATLAKIANALDHINNVNSAISEATATAGKDVVPSTDTEDVVLITRHLAHYRAYAYMICAVAIMVSAVITYQLTYQWTPETLDHFWVTMVTAFVVDLFVVDVLYVFLVLLYRRITHEYDAKAAVNAVHPYEGEQEHHVYRRT